MRKPQEEVTTDSWKITIFIIMIGSTLPGGLWPSYKVLLFFPVSTLSPQIPILRSNLNNLTKQIEKTRKSLALSVRDEDSVHIGIGITTLQSLAVLRLPSILVSALEVKNKVIHGSNNEHTNPKTCCNSSITRFYDKSTKRIAFM